MQSELCLICIEEITPSTNYTHPKLCQCKVKMHIECLDKMNHYGLACPICRIKIVSKKIRRYTEYYLEALFLEHPSAITFILFLLFSFVFTIFYIAPRLIIDELIKIIRSRMLTWCRLHRDSHQSNHN